MMGGFHHISPWWNFVDDLGMDLTDRILTVDIDDRAAIANIMEDPWLTQISLYGA